MSKTGWRNEWETEMDPDQLRELELGLEEGLDVSFYANKEFLAIQMQEIRKGLKNGIDVSVYAKTAYDWFQMKELRKGLQHGLDIGQYSSPTISYDRMRQIRKGLEKGLNLARFAKLDAAVLRELRKSFISKVNILEYVKKGYRAEQLEEIRIALENGLNIGSYLDIGYRGASIRQIRIGLEHGVDVEHYAKIEYSWQQMREIRLGLEGRLDVSLYENQIYSASQMKEIRLGLEFGIDVNEYRSLVYTVSDMKKIRTRLQDRLTKVLTGTSEQELETVLVEDFVIEVANDDMEVYLKIQANKNKEYSSQDLEIALKKEGISEGILYEELERMVQNRLYNTEVLVAKGTAPQKGEDGWYEYFFSAEDLGKPKILEDGSVDYQNINWFELVEEGSKIAYYHEPTEGIQGKTVRGEVLSAMKGKEQKVLTGKGFILLYDKKTYVAAYNGKVELNIKAYELNVSRICVMEEVTLATGNVNFDGCVYVKGDVGRGTQIIATEDIVIDGIVEAAKIKCGGNVLLRKGMNGLGGYIEAEGNIEGKFFESVFMSAGQDVHANECMNCEINSNGCVIISGTKGVLAGGIVQSVKGIKTYHLGNRAQLATTLRMGVNDNILKQKREVEKKLDSVLNELSILGNAHIRFQRTYPAEIRNMNEMYIKIENAIYTKELEQEALYKKKRQLEKHIEKMADAKAIIRGTLYEGCIIEIDKLRWLSTRANNITIQRTNNRISIVSN